MIKKEKGEKMGQSKRQSRDARAWPAQHATSRANRVACWAMQSLCWLKQIHSAPHTRAIKCVKLPRVCANTPNTVRQAHPLSTILLARARAAPAPRHMLAYHRGAKPGLMSARVTLKKETCRLLRDDEHKGRGVSTHSRCTAARRPRYSRAARRVALCVAHAHA